MFSFTKSGRFLTGGDITASVTSITHVSKLLDTKVGPVSDSDLEGLMDTILKNTVEPMVNNMNRPNQEILVPDWLITSHVT